ncbi:hypothetical protein SCUP234_12356 [Seiridium cupressi]
MPTLLIESVNLSDTMARLISAVSSIVYFFAALAAAPLVERYGRRIMMIVSTAIQFFCFLLMTTLLYYAQKEGYSGQEEAAKASVVFFFLYYIGFGLGMLGIPWLYPTEINSLPMRTKGAATATMSDWITNFIVVEVTPIGVQSLADRTLEDLDAYYRDNPSLIVTRDRDAISRKRPEKYAETQQRDIREVELDKKRTSVEHRA